MTVLDLLNELRSFEAAGITQAEIVAVEKKPNVEVPQHLIDAWCEGQYDEDPNYLVNEIIELL